MALRARARPPLGVVELRRNGHILLIGPRAALSSLPRVLLLRGEESLRLELQGLLGNASAMAALRRLYSEHARDGDIHRMTNHQVIRRIAAFVSGGRLAAVRLPDGGGYARTLVHAGRRAQPPQPPAGPTAGWSLEEKFAAVLRLTPDALPGELRQAFAALLEPETLAIAVAVLAIWAASHLAGIGFLADGVLIGIGFAAAGWAIFGAIDRIADFVRLTVDATSERDLKRAAAALAEAIAEIGVAAFVALLARGAVRAPRTISANAPTGSTMRNPGVSRARTGSPKRTASQRSNDGGTATPQSKAGSEPSGESKSAPIARQKQDGHIPGTPQHANRVKHGKPTSTFDDPGTADQVTRHAWENGQPVPGRPGLREYDFGRRIGTGPNGGGQTKVRVHVDRHGRIHGHPVGPEH